MELPPTLPPKDEDDEREPPELCPSPDEPKELLDEEPNELLEEDPNEDLDEDPEDVLDDPKDEPKEEPKELPEVLEPPEVRELPELCPKPEDLPPNPPVGREEPPRLKELPDEVRVLLPDDGLETGLLLLDEPEVCPSDDFELPNSVPSSPEPSDEDEGRDVALPEGRVLPMEL